MTSVVPDVRARLARLGPLGPVEGLARLVADDALELRPRVRARLARGALLLDAEDAWLRAQALCAWHAARAGVPEDAEPWLAARVEEALAGLLAEGEPGAAHAALAAPLGLDARSLAAACARFGRLAPALREAFFALVLDGAAPDAAARARGVSLTELARRARAGLEPFRALLAAPDAGAPERGARPDAVAWLVPDGSAAALAALRRLVTALRLLRDDARAPGAERVAPQWTRVRGELARVERAARLEAVESLLHAHLLALRPPGSFLDVPAPALDHAAAWRLLVAPGLHAPVAPPAPLEPAASVCTRLLAVGAACGAGDAWTARHAAALRHVSGGPAEAERRWYALLRAALEPGAAAPEPARIAPLLAGLVAARLERGDPGRAWSLHARFAGLARDVPELRRRFAWSALACGERDAARALLAGLPPAPLPRPLAELAADGPAWAELLGPGDGAPDPRGPASSAEARDLDPPALGAVLVAVVALHGPRAQVLALARAGRAARGDARPDSESVTRLLDARDLVRIHAHGGAAPAGALHGAGTRAFAVAAVRGADGTLAGWVQVECAHHLLPEAARVAALARAWRAAVLAAGAPRVAGTPRALGVRVLPLPAGDPRAEVVARLVAAAAATSGLRAAWVEPDGGAAALRAARGRALSLAAPGGGVLARATGLRGPATHAGEAGEALHAGARAGAAVPLVGSAGTGRVLGWLVLESARVEDAQPLAARAADLLRVHACELRARAFQAATRARGAERVLAPGSRFLARLAPALDAAASARGPLLVVGPRGAGRRTLAAWLHFLGAGADDALLEGLDGGPEAARLLDLATLAAPVQAELAAECGGALFLVADAPADALRARGELAPELERRLEPLPLLVPPLRDRRDEVPVVARVVLEAEARRAGIAAARLDDGGAAALWRQDWRGHARELAALAAQLARAHPGRDIGASEVRAAFRARGLEWRERLPSLRPRRLDLELAVETTRHASGGWNRARAARYLGWDPATLATRLAERGLAEPPE